MTKFFKVKAEEGSLIYFLDLYNFLKRNDYFQVAVPENKEYHLDAVFSALCRMGSLPDNPSEISFFEQHNELVGKVLTTYKILKDGMVTSVRSIIEIAELLNIDMNHQLEKF
ncbi:MAG: hypothetical protein IB618_00885 [Candidatus Pacearchaeota archaeon]|nr:MAG: hypothetical protein IB618_00885 [Candidatus Pacearchaeota archaeon]